MKNKLTHGSFLITPDYQKFIEGLKERVSAARLSASRAINHDLILLYWDIGREIVEKQKMLGWGDSVVGMVADDLKCAFPEVTGFSLSNIWRMRQLYAFYSSEAILAQAAREFKRSLKSQEFLKQTVTEKNEDHSTSNHDAILAQAVRELSALVPWGHHVLLLGKIKSAPSLMYYLQAVARFGWSRNVLLNQIKAGAYERAVTEKKTHNFDITLPEHFAEQAVEMLKSSYSLEFLGINRAVKERQFEDRLISRLQAFILELGYGFCFVGRQYRLTLGTKEYFIDLLFYHRFLKALVAFELKVGPFEPEYAGKMDFYLNVLNDKERAPGDRPSIGIVLCAEKDDVEVEYVLRTKNNPIGVAAYKLQTKLPVELKGKLPTEKQLAGVVRAEMGNRIK